MDKSEEFLTSALAALAKVQGNLFADPELLRMLKNLDTLAWDIADYVEAE